MKKKHVILSIILILVAIILYYPVSSYTKTLKLYYKFHSSISFDKDSIFKEDVCLQSYIPTVFNDTTRLFYLCKIWGVLKYHYENTDGYVPPIDSLLLYYIDKSTSDKLAFQSDICDLISKVQTTELTGKNPYPNINDYHLINNDWMNDIICLNSEISSKLKSIFDHRRGLKNHFIFNKSVVGNIRLMNEIAYNEKELPDKNIRLLGLFRFWNIINYFYVSKNLMDDNWDKILYESIPLFINAKTTRQYHLAIYWMISKLKDTHASYPHSIDPVTTGGFRPNFRMLLIDSMFVIHKIRDSNRNDNKFQIGDILLEIDGQDIYSLYDSLQQYTCGGNYWSNQSFVCNAVLSRFDTISSVKLIRDNDTIEAVSKNYLAYDLFQAQRKQERLEEDSVLYKWINDSIAYMDLTSATEKNFKRNYDVVKSANVIILDLRCYPDVDLILPLTNTFVPPNSFFAYSTYPDTRFPGMVRFLKSSSNKIGSKNYYKGEIIVLVDEWTQSYSEYITMALQRNARTVTIGRYSSGADGNYSLFNFPGNVKTIFTGIGIYYPDFTPTQRRGVKIDYIVEPNIEDIKNKRDAVYEKAIDIAKQKITK